MRLASVPEQIAELGRLLERGLITRAQFEEQRDHLLVDEGSRSARRKGRPDRIGAYRVLGTVGEGGMGVVYRGRHRSAGIARRQGGEVAIKVLHPRLARNPVFIQRFEREATLGLELEHPGLVRAFDLIFDGDVIAFVMELVSGVLLSNYIKGRSVPIRWDDVWHMFKQVLEAVSYAHSQGVIHRDLKPDNIIVGENGKLRVIDLGIAKGASSKATETGLAMGTVDYMAPEQHEDAKRVTVRADVYSLAMTLYEMLAGRLPWEDSLDSVGVLAAKRRGRFVPPSHFAADIPQQVVKALMPALDPDPKRRYRSVDELRAALETAHFRTALGAEEDTGPPLVSEESDDPEDGLETEPSLILEQTASGRFQAVRAAQEYSAGSSPENVAQVEAGGDSEDPPPPGAVAQFWRAAVDDSVPELPARLADFRARKKRRQDSPRPSPGRGGAVPLEHRRVKRSLLPVDPRSRTRMHGLVFVAVLVIGLGLGFNGWLGYASQLWELEDQNASLVEEIEEQKAVAQEVRELMEEDGRIRGVLTFLDEAERRRRLPALALDRIEVSKPTGLLWIESIEINESDFRVNALVQSESRADEMFISRLEAGPLVSDENLTSRTTTQREDGLYDQIRVEGALSLPKAKPRVGGGL